MKKYTYDYPHPAVTADCIALSPEGGEMHVLLVQRKNEPFKGHWAFPGGFMKIDEDAPAAARRELREETGIAAGQLMQIGAYTRPDRDPRERVITVAHLALVKKCEVVGGDDAANAQWFDINDLPELAFDHQQILDDALEELRCRIHYKPI